MNPQKEKGKRYERKIAGFYRKNLGFDTKRGLQARDGSEAPDVVVNKRWWWVECKHYASGGLVHRAYEQSKAAADKDRLIIVHTHEDEGEDLVTVSLADWEKLLLQAQGWRRFKNFI